MANIFYESHVVLYKIKFVNIEAIFGRAPSERLMEFYENPMLNSRNTLRGLSYVWDTLSNEMSRSAFSV